MPPLEQLLAFAAVSVVFVATPGPSVVFTIGRALTYGRIPAIYSVVGNAAGVFLHVIAVAVGIGAIVQRSVAVFTILKVVGAGYLIYLGVQAIRRRHALSNVLDEQAEPLRSQRSVLDGFVVGVSNPKSIVFFAAILPQFVDPTAGAATGQLLVLGLVPVGVALVSDSLWALLAGAARNWFGRSPRRLASIGGAGGLAMLGLGINLAFTGRKD